MINFERIDRDISNMMFAPLNDAVALIKEGAKELTIAPSSGSVVSSVLKALGKIAKGVVLYPIAVATVSLVTVPLTVAASVYLASAFLIALKSR